MTQISSAEKKSADLLILLCAVVYFTGYVTRLGLLTTISEVIACGMATHRVASLAETLNLIFYGGGQLLSGFLGDRIKPQKLILIGLLTTCSVNLAVGLGIAGNALLILWPVNGLAQAFLWPPMVAILTQKLTAEQYDRGMVRVCFGSSSGTVAMYLLCPLIIRTVGLKYVFLFAALWGFAVTFVWWGKTRRFSVEKPTVKQHDSPAEKRGFSAITVALLAALILIIAFQGMLRDGVQTWTPSMLVDLHGIDTSSAILSSVILPVFGFLSISLASFVQRKLILNEPLATAAFFGLSAVCGGILTAFAKNSMILSVALTAVIIGCAHAENMLLTCIVPRAFAGTGRVSFLSGLLNSGTYIGSAVAVYLFGTLGEDKNWIAVVLLWTVIAVGGAPVCLAISKPWEKFKRG